MNIFWLKIAIWMTTLGWPGQIIERNRAKLRAEEAYQQKNYEQAISYYQYLERTQLVPEPDMILNLAHAAFANQDTALAISQYQRLTRVDDEGISSIALNQLGVLNCYSADTAQAEKNFREALVRNPGNEQARYNYEIIRRLYHPRDRMAQAPPPPKSTAPSTEKVASEVKLSSRKEEVLKSLNQVNITEEQALRILESSRNQEVQYLQQHPHKAENVAETKEKW